MFSGETLAPEEALLFPSLLGQLKGCAFAADVGVSSSWPSGNLPTCSLWIKLKPVFATAIAELGWVCRNAAFQQIRPVQGNLPTAPPLPTKPQGLCFDGDD